MPVAAPGVWLVRQTRSSPDEGAPTPCLRGRRQGRMRCEATRVTSVSSYPRRAQARIKDISPYRPEQLLSRIADVVPMMPTISKKNQIAFVLAELGGCTLEADASERRFRRCFHPVQWQSAHRYRRRWLSSANSCPITATDAL